MRVLVTGASGQLGHDVSRELERRGIDMRGTSSRSMDITDEAAVQKQFRDYRPDVVIHCAAYTKVDQAEDEPDKCWAVNADGTKNVAMACREFDAALLYISTDYVFPGEGERFYQPDDPVGPLGVYGRSKLAGELAVQTLLEKWFTVRISWVFGKHGSNFVRSMLRLAESHETVRVVCDQIGSPTYTADLAPLLCDMAGTEKYGIYHATNEGVCSWAEFAGEIFRLSGKDTAVQHISTAEYPSRAVRPLNSRMSKDKLEQAGLRRLPHWQDALKRYLADISDM